MKALIIGGNGFVGKHLVKHLKNDKHWDVYITKRGQNPINTKVDGEFNLDILNKEEIKEVIKKVSPDYVFHLAAQSSVAVSWENPLLTVDVNIKGTINLLDAIRECEVSPRILIIGSGEEYGYILPDEIPIPENNLLRPGNIYAATKVAQNMISKVYTDAYKMDIVLVRAFNHIGPGQSPLFVVSDFCKQIVEIKKGIRKNIIKVGNLSAKRDFTDVRDVVKAYSLLIEKGKKGETYNVGSNKAIAIQDILNKIIKISGIEVKVIIDSEKLRPVDVPVIEADTRKIKSDIGWEKEIDIDKTIKDTITYWENNL